MATIVTAKRVLALSKGLVTLSNTVSRNEISGTKVGIALACSALAVAATQRYVAPWVHADNVKLKGLLEGGGADPEEADNLIEDVRKVEQEEVVYVGDVPLIMTTPPPETDKPSKRRVRKGCRGKFIREIVAAVKLRLGTPKPTMANRRAVQRVAREEMKDYNLRKTVASSIMPMIVEAVFVPTKWEVEAARLGSSMLAQSRKTQVNLLLGLAGFNQA